MRRTAAQRSRGAVRGAGCGKARRQLSMHTRTWTAAARCGRGTRPRGAARAPPIGPFCSATRRDGAQLRCLQRRWPGQAERAPGQPQLRHRVRTGCRLTRIARCVAVALRLAAPARRCSSRRVADAAACRAGAFAAPCGCQAARRGARRQAPKPSVVAAGLLTPPRAACCPAATRPAATTWRSTWPSARRRRLRPPRTRRAGTRTSRLSWAAGVCPVASRTPTAQPLAGRADGRACR